MSLLIVASILALLPTVLAYPTIYPAYDLYTVFVEGIFGGFWLSVIGLTIIMYILLGMIGKISQYTVMNYCAIFVYAMAIGYTQPLIIIPIWVALIGNFIFQGYKYINSASVA